MRADDGDDGGNGCSAFRCLDVARYTVAAAVTVLIVVVIVAALKVMLRPEPLLLSVVDGTVYSTPQPPNKTVLELNLRADNPSGRARMYFLDVIAHLFDDATPASTSKPDEDCIIYFVFQDGRGDAVPQQKAVGFTMTVEGTNDPLVMNQTYFDMLYTKRGIISDATLRVKGSLVTELSSVVSRTQPFDYYCRPLLVGGAKGGEASNGRKDVLCTENLAKPI